MATSENTSQELTPQEKGELKDRARWLRRVANPFVDFYIIVAVGAAGSPTTSEVARRCEDKQTRDHAKNLTPVQHKIYAEDFNHIIGNLPFLKKRLESDDPSRVIKKITNKIQSAADQGKQSDTKGVKYNIAELIPRNYIPHGEDGDKTVHDYIKVKTPGAIKSWRGWGNPLTARLLCPIDYVAEFKANPDGTRAKLGQGELPLIDNAGDPKFPAFLYDEETTDGSLAQGLFRGPFLLAVYKYIFISPSGATGTKASSKRGNAKIHGMEDVIPSTICYAAIHAYIGLCCIKTWGEEWKGVKFPRLYILLREQFAHPDDPWCKETLDWWNEKVFGGSTETDEDAQEVARDVQGPSMRERMENERQVRMRAAADN